MDAICRRNQMKSLLIMLFVIPDARFESDASVYGYAGRQESYLSYLL